MSVTVPAHPVFVQHGRTGPVCGIAVVNALLNLVTLGIWRFWGRTRIRRFLWDSTTAWGDPLEYTGTGKELFRGFLMVLVVVFLPVLVVSKAVEMLTLSNPDFALLFLPLNLFLVFLVGAGLYRARRYQLTRTLWRGIRANQRGSAGRYGLMWVGALLADLASLGWTHPWSRMALARHRLANTTFGNQAFRCEARARGLYGRFALLWAVSLLPVMGALAAAGAVQNHHPNAIIGVIVIATAGLVVLLWIPAFAWYQAAFLRALAEGTRFGGMSFRADVGTWRLMRLAAGNLLIAALSLGALIPWTVLRRFRFFCKVISADGEPDWSAIHQGADERPATGEGLLSVFDGGGDF